MPTPYIGGQYEAPVPDVAQIIALGYTHVRIYWAASETAAGSLVSTQALAATDFTYSYNKVDAGEGDFAYHAFYSVANGEGPPSERVAIAPTQPRSTRLAIRQGVGRRLRLLKVVEVTTAVDGDEFIAAELIDPDASAHAYASWFARAVSGAQAGEIRRIRRQTNNGYVAATGKITVSRAFGGTLQVGDRVELWKPKGEDDPSTQIDEAINECRRAIWWEDDLYVVTEESTTDYALPGFVEIETQVKEVNFAAGEYPRRPSWQPVARAEARRLGGQVWLTNVESNALSRQPFATDTILQVIVNRSGDALDDDADAWDGCPSLDWAIAESAWAFLQTDGMPVSGSENTKDVDRAQLKIEADVLRFRRVYMPSAAVRTELAK